jgi:hypothetical protein
MDTQDLHTCEGDCEYNARIFRYNDSMKFCQCGLKLISGELKQDGHCRMCGTPLFFDVRKCSEWSGSDFAHDEHKVFINPDAK